MTVITTQPGAETYFASTTEPNAIEDTVSSATIQQTIAFAHQPSLTDFDKRLIKLAGVTDADLNLLLGRRLMIEHHYAEAANAFAKVNPKIWANEAFTTVFSEESICH